MPLVNRTRAIFRKAEFGFFGVIVRTTVHTPRFCGAPSGCRKRRCVFELKVYSRAGALLFTFFDFRPLRTSWLIVGKFASRKSSFDQTIYDSNSRISIPFARSEAI
jgi:hypothetical protein